MHILTGKALSAREAERKGLVHETVSGKALDRAMEIARRLSSHTPESLAYIKMRSYEGKKITSPCRGFEV